MNITLIELKHTNPSLGPHEVKTTVSLPISAEHEERVNTFLDTSKVNNTVSLREYIHALQTQNTPVIDQVNKNAPNEPLAVGETISSLYIHFQDEQPIKFYDVYRRYNLSHFYPDFTSYMVEKGSIIKGQAFDKF